MLPLIDLSMHIKSAQLLFFEASVYVNINSRAVTVTLDAACPISKPLAYTYQQFGITITSPLFMNFFD